MPRRRPPKQDRAHETIADLLAATQRIIEKDGHEALTTNRIARVAGVAVGSLYQYFASKEAVVAALQEQHFERMGKTFLSRMEELETSPLDELVHGLASLMRNSELLNSRLSKQLLAIPQRGRPHAVLHIEQQCAEILQRALGRLAPRADPADLRVAIFMVVQTVSALILSASQHRPRGLNRQRFTQELANLLIRYLAPVLASRKI